MKSVFDVLEAIQLRPEMYVGGERSQRGIQLQNLELLLHGYALALEAHEVDEPVRNFPREFAHYLRQNYGWSAAAGAVAAIRDAFTDDNEAWEAFWNLIHEFRAAVAARQ